MTKASLSHDWENFIHAIQKSFVGNNTFLLFFHEKWKYEEKKDQNRTLCQSSVFKAISITMSIAWNKANANQSESWVL